VVIQRRNRDERESARRAGIAEDEVGEWLESLEDVLQRHGPEEAERLLAMLYNKARRAGVDPPYQLNSPYMNTIPRRSEPRYPGSYEIERRIKSIVRWNAMAMVARANREFDGIGGHISTFASAATLYEVGLNHFFKAPTEDHPGDFVFFQGHASPGIYARAWLEGRLSEDDLLKFRRETGEGGLSSYPHPWLMPGFWQFPTVSMGLGPLSAIYQARFNRYLHDRGIKDTSDNHVWCFVGDGETDEPETLGSISLAAREGLDNLIFVINCNLQRLDGPVRGNGKIIQELERNFRGAGWNVLKVVWGGDWDPLLEADVDGRLVQKMNETLDGQYQKYSVEAGGYIREHFFDTPELRALVEHYTDDQLARLTRGGHDSRKVYAAYKAAVDHVGAPTVILAKTIKGYGLGEAGEGRNVTHQQKKLNAEELRAFRARFGIPIGDEELASTPFYKPPDDSPEMVYLHERRQELGGYLPTRRVVAEPLEVPPLDDFDEFLKGSEDRDVATTMAFVRMLARLLKNDRIGGRIVPIVPDEARTFGMDALFRQHGIYSHVGQLYEPVDRQSLLYYREAKDGKILEEGITEAGSMASFTAAGTAYAHHGIEMVPFYTFYSMFGFQRIGDSIWAAADSRAKGFLLGGTAGRTTLNGEGLQHQDGHSHLLAATVPNVCAYDPAYAYEVAVIVQDGLRRMYAEGEVLIYYLTLYNETYPQPALPDGDRSDVVQGIVKGMYRLEGRDGDKGRVQLLGSGPILREALRAAEILADRYGVGSDVWSVTSYKELRREAMEVERDNRLHPEREPRRSYLEEVTRRLEGPFVAVSDYMRLVPEQIARWLPGRMVPLGTDGFGRSDTREALRRHFEIDAENVVYAALSALVDDGALAADILAGAINDLGLDPDTIDPVRA
jgi:pyruvate dehydrogenase E1 component